MTKKLSQKAKFQKKKDREKRVKAKMLRRREAIRRSKKEEEEKEKALEREYFDGKEAGTLTEQKRDELLEKLTGKAVKKLTPEDTARRDELIVNRLKANIAMLEELEKSYLAEQEARKQTNQAMEEGGAETLKGKLETLQQKTHEKLLLLPDDVQGEKIAPTWR